MTDQNRTNSPRRRGRPATLTPEQRAANRKALLANRASAHTARDASRAIARTSRPPRRPRVYPFVGVSLEYETVEGVRCATLLRVGQHVVTGAPLTTDMMLGHILQYGSLHTAGWEFSTTELALLMRSSLFRMTDDEYLHLLAGDPVAVGGYWVRVVAGKTLEVAGSSERPPFNFPVRVNDIANLLRGKSGTLVSVAEDWDVLSAANLEALTSHDPLVRSEVRCRVAAALMETVRVELRRLGMTPQRWYSAGSLASDQLRRHGVAEYRPERPNHEMQGIADAAVYGGSTELVVQGWSSGPMLHLDVRSMYPSILAGLPCRRHGRWSSGTTLPTDGSRALVRVSWNVPDPDLTDPSAVLVGPFPWRGATGTEWPLQADGGWYGDREVAQAMKVWPGCVTVHEVRTWHTDCEDHGCDGKPFGFVPALFELRKTSGPVAGLVKSCLVAIAGKIGERDDRWRAAYADSAWAAWTYSDGRAVLLGAAAAAGRRLVSTATDSISVEGTDPVPGLVIGDELGQWSPKILPTTFWLSPARAFTDSFQVVRRGGLDDFEVALMERAVRALGQSSHIQRVWKRSIQLGEAGAYTVAQIGQVVTVTANLSVTGINGRRSVPGTWWSAVNGSRFGTIPMRLPSGEGMSNPRRSRRRSRGAVA